MPEKNPREHNPIRLLLKYISLWKTRVLTASIFSALNKIFAIAPEVLIGVAVDLVCLL